MSKSQRTKGHSWERDVAAYFREWFPVRVVRRSQQGDRAYEPDVVVEPFWDNGATPCEPDPAGLWPECISSNRPPIWEKLEQAIRDVEAAKSGKLPCVFAKRTQGKGTKGYEVVVMRLEDFAKFAGWT